MEAVLSRTTVFVFLCVVGAVNILTRSSHRNVCPLAKGKGPGYISICFPIKTKIFSYEHNQEKALLTPGKTAAYTEQCFVLAALLLWEGGEETKQNRAIDLYNLTCPGGRRLVRESFLRWPRIVFLG